MLSRRVMDYIKKNNVKYRIIEHSRAYTSQETAQSAHISGKKIAKPVMIMVNGEMRMVVLPAHEQIDMGHLMDLFNTTDVHLAHESEFAPIFSDCEPGGEPPFGNLYGMEVYVQKDLARDEIIAFNGGDHEELVRMSYKDYERLVRPFVIS